MLDATLMLSRRRFVVAGAAAWAYAALPGWVSIPWASIPAPTTQAS